MRIFKLQRTSVLYCVTEGAPGAYVGAVSALAFMFQVEL